MSVAPAPPASPGNSLPTESGRTVLVGRWHGEGSYARVYHGVYGPEGVPCAVKVPKLEIEESVERLARGAEVLARVRHPRLVALLDRGRPATFVVLEWLEGETLHERLQARRRLPLRETLTCLEEAAEGLAAIHAAGLVHGDLRAQNVILARERGAVLTDPGGGGLPDGDVRALAAALHLMLTGRPEGGHLTVRAGHNPGVVRLWERMQAMAVAPVELIDEVRRLRASL